MNSRLATGIPDTKQPTTWKARIKANVKPSYETNSKEKKNTCYTKTINGKCFKDTIKMEIPEIREE